MCIIVFDNRLGTGHLDKEVLERCQKRNKDGMGIMYPYKGDLITYTTMKDLGQIWERYIEARRLELPVAMHFRLGTAGANDSWDNCHPFNISKNFAFMHNGTISGLSKHRATGESDTRTINKELFQKLPADFLKSPVIRETIQQLILGDRMLFMDGSGLFTIINGDRWGATWKDGVWWSKGYNITYFLTGEEKNYTTDYQAGSSQFAHSADDKDDELLHWWNKINRGPQQLSSGYKRTAIEEKSKKLSKREKKRIAKKAATTARAVTRVSNPTPSKGANLLFDYGFLSRIGYSDDRLLKVGEGIVGGQQLWAIGQRGTENPAAIVTRGCSMLGTIYAVTKEYEKAISVLDARHGTNEVDPAASVYTRHYVRANFTGDKKSELWVWLWNYAIPLSKVGAAAVVPFGDWSRFRENGSKLPVTDVGTIIVDRVDLNVNYRCPICTSSDTIPRMIWEDKTDYILMCYTCKGESFMVEREVIVL